MRLRADGRIRPPPRRPCCFGDTRRQRGRPHHRHRGRAHVDGGRSSRVRFAAATTIVNSRKKNELHSRVTYRDTCWRRAQMCRKTCTAIGNGNVFGGMDGHTQTDTQTHARTRKRRRPKNCEPRNCTRRARSRPLVGYT